MKSILVGPKEKENKKPEYPCLMISMKGRVVLFSSPEYGTVVHISSEEKNNSTPVDVGHFSKDWSMSAFEPLKGKITLSN